MYFKFTYEDITLDKAAPGDVVFLSTCESMWIVINKVTPDSKVLLRKIGSNATPSLLEDHKACKRVIDSFYMERGAES